MYDYVEREALTGAQRLVRLYIKLLGGQPISPSAYAKETGVKRQTVYHQFDLLSQAGIPVVQVGYGQWALLDYAEQISKWMD